MKRSILTYTALTAFAAMPALAQQGELTVAQASKSKADTIVQAGAPQEKGADKAARKSLLVPTAQIDRIRPNDQRGLTMFETPKASNVPFTGFKLAFGAAFTQQFQGLQHSNTAAVKNAVDATGKAYNANQLITIGHGFNNAVANLYLNAQVARGVRVAMTSYLSARHHNETWVKDGYFQIDDSPIDNPLLNRLMQNVTLKAGHFEINYGDSHFRRTDNGQSIYNPFVGNLILDPFVPQVGAEAYLKGTGRLQGAFVMGGVTNGEEKGMVGTPAKRSPAFLGKIGVDKQVTSLVRARLTGSLYSQARAANEVLYSGDRAGSRYYDVLENTVSTEAAQAWSGMVQPFSGPSAGLHAAVINPFIKVGGLEYFASFEKATGRGATETANRTIKQSANEVVYRFLDNDLFLGARYNTVTGRLAGIANDIKVQRSQLAAGWFITPLVETKLEWVNQKYLDFPTSDIRNGGQFKGFVIEGAVAF